MNKYCYSFNKEDYHEGYDTIQDAIDAWNAGEREYTL